jgi:hypothetical protein
MHACPLQQKQLPFCMREVSKIALQACIMNSPLNIHALESKLLEMQKIRENVSSKQQSIKFTNSKCNACHCRNFG